MKKAFILVLILIPFWLMAQDMPFTVKSSTRYSVSGMVGTVRVDSVKYYQFRMIQEFKYKKFGLGLDFDFLFDKDYHLKKNDWDELKDILGKIYYFKFAETDDPFYFHLGGFPNRTLRNGLVMLNYSNMRFYPEQRNNGLLIGGSPHWPMQPTIELFTSNIEKNQIFAISANIKPMPDSTVKYLDELILGFAGVADRNQKGGLKAILADSVYNSLQIGKSKPASVFSFDYSLPFSRKKNATFGHYAEIAHITDYGTGFILPGVYADFKSLRINLEYRIYGSKFAPAFFDHLYEEDRAIYEDSTIIIKEEMLDAIKPSYGWYGKVQTNIKGKFKTLVAWQDMYGKDLQTGKSLWLRLWAETRYKRLENISLAYSKTNVNTLALKKIAVPSARAQGSLTFSLNEKRRWFFIGKYSEEYKDKNKDGEIDWLKEARRSFGVGVKYTF